MVLPKVLKRMDTFEQFNFTYEYNEKIEIRIGN